MPSVIKAERERAGLTQERLAHLAGIAQSNLSAIESGKRAATPQMLERLRRCMRRPSQALVQHRNEVLQAITECGACDPRVFGSVANGTDVPGSDLDILVTVPPDNAWRFVSLKPRLVSLLGIDVDVVSESGLKEKHQAIVREAVPL